MIRNLYGRTMALANGPHALWALAVVAFVESSVFPIPPDVLMIPMILARPSRAWLIALVALVGSVLGGLLGYAIGALAFEGIGQPILDALGKGHAADEFNTTFNEWGAWAVLIAGVPIPLQGHHHHVRLDGPINPGVHRLQYLRPWPAVLRCCRPVVEIRRTHS